MYLIALKPCKYVGEKSRKTARIISPSAQRISDGEYNRMYINYFNENKNRSNEMNFLKFMDEHMYVKGVTLVKMNSNGTFTKKTLSADKTQVVDADCP